MNDGIEMISPHRSNRKKHMARDDHRLRHRYDGAGWWNVSSLEFNGNIASWFAGNATSGIHGFVRLAAMVILLKQF